MSNTKGSSDSNVLGAVSTGSLREWLSKLSDQAHDLQSTSHMLEKAITVLNSSNEITTNEKSLILKKRNSQLLKVNQALGVLNLEIKVIGSKCNQFEGQDCDGILPQCDPKCKTCSSFSNSGQCTSCYGNFDGATCSTCKFGWTGSDCNSIDNTGEITNSSILTSAPHRIRFMNEIMNGVSLQNASQPTLLFRASRDGFSASTFHSKCDNKGATIVIVKSQSGGIFGGYTTKSWSSNFVGYVSDSLAFMFSLISPTGTERFTKLIQENGWHNKHGNDYIYSIYQKSVYGPTFGGGNDFFIADNANNVTSSYSNLCRSYCDTTMTVGNITTKEYLTGSDKFVVSDYEVYTF